MRTERIERILADAINKDDHLTARTYTEANYTRSPRGIIATTPTGIPVNIQIAGRLADGERHNQKEQPVTGAPHQPHGTPNPTESGSLDLAVFEQYLAGLIVAAASDEIKNIALYQDRDTPGAVRYGLTITYHSGAATFLYVLSAGATRHEEFAPPATVSA